MDNVSLYRKYRPHNFDNLIGQDHIKTTLINALKSDRVAHAYLFTGPRGTGKTSTARLVAKALNCTDLQNGFEPCDKCSICQDISVSRLIDLVEIDAASNRGIDEVRDLKEKINFAPSHARYKVYIIDEVHMMTNEAFNALLKTLEEPPAHAYFILATTEIHKIPSTIISRCQRFDFRRISEKAILTRLNYIAQNENIKVEEKALEVIAKYVAGGLRDAIGLLEQLTSDDGLSYEHVHEILGVSDLSLLESIFKVIDEGDVHGALKIVHELYSQGSDLQQFLHEFIDLLRRKMLDSVASGDQRITGKLLELIGLFQEAFSTFNPSLPQLSMEIAVIKATSSFTKSEMQAVAVDKNKVKKVEKLKVPAVEENPAVKRELVKKAVDLDLSKILQQWPRVTERVKHPSLRMSIRNAEPVVLQEVDLTLQFSI